MKIGVIGAGYVGLVTAACLAEFGFDLLCCDKEQSRIDMLRAGKSPIFEPGLEQLLEKHAKSQCLDFTHDIKQLVQSSDVLFIAVGTPSHPTTGEADLTAVFNVADEIAAHINGDKVIVTKSTVPVGTTRRLQQYFDHQNLGHIVHMVANPEFLREGSAIEDFMRPDRVIIGAATDHAKHMMDMIYKPLYLYETPIAWMDFESAEITKYASNSFLATKVAFINEIADLCEETGATIDDVAKGLGLDQRIGAKFLHPSPGYGGSCFPKDTLAIRHMGRDHDVNLGIIDAVIHANDTRKKSLCRRIAHFMHKTGLFNDPNTPQNSAQNNTRDNDNTPHLSILKNKKIAVLGLSFKPNTDDMRDSPSLVLIPDLIKAGASVQAFDPEAMIEAEKRMPASHKLAYKKDIDSTLDGADILVVLTEWNVFRALDIAKIRDLLNYPIICDYRNIFDPQTAFGHGVYVDYVGRQDVLPNGENPS